MSENLPVGWSIRPLGDLAQVVSGGTPSRNVGSFWDEGEIPWITPTDITAIHGKYISESKDRITKAGLMSCSASLLPPGSILMTSRATLGEAKISTMPACTNQGFKSLVPNKGISNEFLYYQIQRTKAEYARYGSGSTFLEVGKKDTLAFPVLIPEESNQTLIAEVLSLIDTQIDATRALIAKRERVRAGLMQDVLRRGVDERGRLRPSREEAPHLYRQTELGWLPKAWEVEAFGKRLEVIDPNPTHRYPDEIAEGVPICSTENFEGTDSFDVSFAKHVSEATFVFQNNRCDYHPLDVVFARKGRIGLARRYGDDRKVFSHTVVTIKPLNQTVDRAWVLWLARSDAFLSGIARKMNSNSGVPTLGIEFIKSIHVPFPPEPEQSSIAQLLDEASSVVSALETDLSKLLLRKSGLMQDLLTGKVPVAPLLESIAA